MIPPSLLATVPFFASLGEEELQALAEVCRTRRLKPAHPRRSLEP